MSQQARELNFLRSTALPSEIFLVSKGFKISACCTLEIHVRHFDTSLFDLLPEEKVTQVDVLRA